MLVPHPRFGAIDGVGLDPPPGAQYPVRLQVTKIAHREVRASFVLTAEQQGAEGRGHGGALMTALDEVLGCACWLELDREDCLTAFLHTNFRRPAIVGRRMDLVGRIVEREGRKLTVKGEVFDEEGLVCDADGLWIVPRPS